jgi:hypothetical protein
MTLIEIKQAIKNGNFSLTELNELSAFTNSVKTFSAKSSINVGDQVYVVQKTKRTLGEVVKVNIKKAIVELPQGRYNVPLSMIESVS